MSLSTPAAATEVPAGQRDRATHELRDRLIDAALVEFAASGFDGASTRAIARRAGAHQPQINYHFASKEDLWKATVERLLSEFDELIPLLAGAPPRDQFAAVIRALVEFAAIRPELNRIMIHEATSSSDRLEWLVETHLRWRAGPLLEVWDEVVAVGGAAPVPRELVYHLLIGASALLNANAPEARMLFGIEPTDACIVAAHADALVAMFLPTHP